MDTKVWLHFPGRKLLHVCCDMSLLRILNIVCVTLLGEDISKLKSVLLWTLPYESFTSATFHLHPFAVINHNSEYNSFLSSASPSS